MYGYYNNQGENYWIWLVVLIIIFFFFFSGNRNKGSCN